MGTSCSRCVPMLLPLRNFSFFSGRLYGYPDPINGKIRTIEPAQVAPRAPIFIGQNGRMIPVIVVLFRKGQNLGRTKLDAKPASLAAVPLEINGPAKLSGFGFGRSLCHFGP